MSAHCRDDELEPDWLDTLTEQICAAVMGHTSYGQGYVIVRNLLSQFGHDIRAETLRELSNASSQTSPDLEH